MSEIVVVNKTNAVVVEDKSSTVVVDTKQPKVIVTGIMGPAGARNFAEMLDTDISTLGDGSILVYSELTNKWTSTVLLNKQTVDCGQF